MNLSKAFAAAACLCLFATAAFAAQPEFLFGEGVSASPTMSKHWVKNCIVQSAPDAQGLYKVSCGNNISSIAPKWMKASANQALTSRKLICPGGNPPKTCFFQ
jgi:hypothetical protein